MLKSDAAADRHFPQISLAAAESETEIRRENKSAVFNFLRPILLTRLCFILAFVETFSRFGECENVSDFSAT